MPKKKVTRKRRRRTVSVNQLVSVKPTRRRRGTRKKGFLSDMVTPAETKGAFRALAGGVGGGIAAALLRRITAGKLNPIWGVLTPFVGGFVAATVLKSPNIGAGLAAVGASQLMQELGLGEKDDMYLQDNNYAQDIKQLPAALDVNGQPMGEDEMDLQDGYQVDYAPEFGSPTVPVTVDEIY